MDAGSSSKPTKADTARLHFALPNRTEPPAGHFLRDAKSTQAWLSDLPMANVGELARQTYAALVEFNQYHFSPKTRLSVSAAFHETVHYLCESLSKHYLDLGLPLGDKAWRTAQLSRELNKQLAMSYKIAIEDLVSQGWDQADPKALLASLQLASYYLREVWLYGSLVYRTPAKGFWQEMHRLYAYARHYKRHRETGEFRLHEETLHFSVDTIYKSLLLLASAAPHGLRQKQIRQSYRHALSWAEQTELGAYQPGLKTVARLHVQLNSDQGPAHNALHLPESNQPVLVLDLHELLIELRSETQSAPWETPVKIGGEAPPLLKPLLQSLTLAWQRPPERAFTRAPLNLELDLLCGLKSVHERLLERARSPEQTAEANLGTAKPESTFNSGSAADVLAQFDLNSLSLEPMSDHRPNAHIERLDSAELFRKDDACHTFVAPWEGHRSSTNESARLRTINASTGGFCIAWQGEGALPKVQVGDVIGIAHDENDQHYQVGIVRWLEQSETHELMVGLQRVSEHADAVNILATASATSGSQALGHSIGLLLVENPGEQDAVSGSLLLAPAHYPPGTEIEATRGEQKLKLRLDKLVEYSSTFAHYEYTQLSHENLPSGSTATPGGSFDDLWKSL